MRWITSLVVAILLAVLPARAEITWLDAPGAYELTGAQLFKLKSELPPELNDSLKALRNQRFPDEPSFRAALAQALSTDQYRASWTGRLVALATIPGAAYGIEPSEGMLTLYVAGADHRRDANSFTSQSWLGRVPAEGTTELSAALDQSCVVVSRAGAPLFRLCQPQIGESTRAVQLETGATHVVGLGQEFQTAGETSAERAGSVRHGFNAMVGFNGGANGNTLFPIAYFTGPQAPFALILDNRFPQEWDLSKAPWRLSVTGGDLRLRVLADDTLAGIRRRYMALSGHPPVPPKAMFGLWISEYGYEDWAELDDRIATLRGAGFPLSGAVLDLYWFGGIAANSATSRMGSLSWDRTHFPDPEDKIDGYAEDGIGIMLIEESYVSSALPEHAALAAHHALAHDAAGAPLVTNPNGNWWGKGGMIDWLNPDGAAFWHDFRRQALIDAGVTAHWTDLGEPEMVNPGFRYGLQNLTEDEAHNSYNLWWARSIFEGYRRSAPDRRPFIMSRSGGMGLQALGGAMWSGDTGGDFGSLAAQMPQQQHMMWSGMDYYGSDIGGFHRSALGIYPGTHEDLTNELYTQWFAYASLFEVPVRPHTENLCNCKETAPDRIGDMASNLANIRLRYALEPYYYSLAYRAWLAGEPVFPSLDYYYADEQAKGVGDQKMIGSELTAVAVAAPGASEARLYLPAGNWYDWYADTKFVSTGEYVIRPIYAAGRLRLPLFAKDGAILPMADGVLRVFGNAPNQFDWYDDDGVSTAYQRGEYLHVAVAVDGDSLTLKRERGELPVRSLIWTRAAPADEVLINGTPVAFESDGNSVRVALPAFEAALTVEIR